MRRFAMDKLLDWKKKSNRKPLILMGARQVGKTWLMKEFGKTYYEKTAYISFYNNQRMQAVFDTDFDIKRIIMNLNIESGVTITPENTLIVLDEPTRNFSPLSGPVIRKMLREFPGAIISISHDRKYIGEVCGKEYLLEKDGLRLIREEK